MSFPVMVDTKCREGSMSSQVFICEQSTRIICTRHTPSEETDTHHATPQFMKVWRQKKINKTKNKTKVISRSVSLA